MREILRLENVLRMFYIILFNQHTRYNRTVELLISMSSRINEPSNNESIARYETTLRESTFSRKIFYIMDKRMNVCVCVCAVSVRLNPINGINSDPTSNYL